MGTASRGTGPGTGSSNSGQVRQCKLLKLVFVSSTVWISRTAQTDGLHLALPIHHSQPILVVFQVEESIFSRPNHRGTRSQAIGAGIEHSLPNTGESGPKK